MIILPSYPGEAELSPLPLPYFAVESHWGSGSPPAGASPLTAAEPAELVKVIGLSIAG